MPAPAPKQSPARKLPAHGSAATEPAEAVAASDPRWTLPSVTANHDYIVNRPGNDAGFSRSAARLPGSGTAIIPGIHMVDPRNQGIAGAVRAVQALFGVADHHCVDVGTWRSMSTEELLARHISPAEVDRTAEAYHCY